MQTSLAGSPAISSAEVADLIRGTHFSTCCATVIGYGNMGREYVKALKALQVGEILVCSLTEGSMGSLKGLSGVQTVAGGYQRLNNRPDGDRLAIVATPTAELIPAAQHLASLGFRKILIEKPVSLWSKPIERLADRFEGEGIAAFCAYNRVAYPSFLEGRFRALGDGGVTSCTYAFTEFIHEINRSLYTAEDLRRWGIANSLHVMSMAHAFIGLPKRWNGHRGGSIPWHPAGSVFVGSGVSERGIPFSYHADWGSMGRWAVEIHTAVASYRLCPLEKIFRKEAATGEWEEVPVTAFSPEAKSGFVEQVAALLQPEINSVVPLISLREAAAFVRYGEELFGY